MKVKATDAYEKLKIEDKELKRTPKEGEIFEVSEERFKILNGRNEYNAIFAQRVEKEETKVITEEEDVDKILNPKVNKSKRK